MDTLYRSKNDPMRSSHIDKENHYIDIRTHSLNKTNLVECVHTDLDQSVQKYTDNSTNVRIYKRFIENSQFFKVGILIMSRKNFA